MAIRRMFSKTIIDNDEFLDMPVSARLLYFDLGMRADDDGFVSPKRIMKFTNATDDDLKILLAKKYVLNFDGKVLVIRDWKVNNFIRPDRYTPTIYQEYLKKLQITSSNQYQLNSGIPEDIPVVGEGKDRLELGKSKDSVKDTTLIDNKDISEIINYFKDISPTNYKDWFGLPPQRKAAKSLLEFHTLEELKVIIEEFLPKINVMPYVSKDCKAFSPKELKENFDKISAKYKELGLQQKQKSGVKIGIVN